MNKGQEDDREKGRPLTQADIDETVEGKTVYKRKALKALLEAKQVERIGKGGKTDPFRHCLKDSRFLVSPYSKEHGNKNPRNSVSAEEDEHYSCSRDCEDNERLHETWEHETSVWEDEA